MKKQWIVLAGLSLIASMVLLIGACATTGHRFASYGQIIPSDAVTEAFESYRIDPDLEYYISGPANEPFVIIGVDKRYTLVSKLWKPQYFVNEQLPYPLQGRFSLRFLVDSMKLKHRYNLRGFDILDNRGRDIGDWYSILPARTVVRMLDPDKVMILTPDADLLHRYQKRWDIP